MLPEEYEKFDMYQHRALYTKTEPEVGENIEIARIALGIPDEAGEIAGAVKKYFRGDFGEIGGRDAKRELRRRVVKEAGDVFWYIAVLADLLEIRLSEISGHNLEKLASRQDRGQIKGDGDNR